MFRAVVVEEKIGTWLKSRLIRLAFHLICDWRLEGEKNFFEK